MLGVGIFREAPFPFCCSGMMGMNDPKRLRLLDSDWIEDRISNLPNAILCHILSFLPTPLAVRTTVLSKRWVNVWTSVSTLDFDEWTMLREFRSQGESVYKQRVNWFINFVKRVLALHDGLNIQKCSLKCCDDFPACYFYQWVSAIITSKVQELIIEAPSQFDVPKQLPSSLFTCQTLIILKVKGKFILNIPTSVCFPCLKTLHLHSVIYPDDTSVERLFASCPVIEDLDIQRRDWDGVLNFKISIPSLKRLSIGCRVDDEEQEDMITKIEVNAPNLEYLDLSDDCLGDYLFSNLTSLVEASVYGESALELLKVISHVRVLRLYGNTMKDLFFVDGADSLPIFHNLTRLELGVDHYLGLQLLEALLESSPNLEDLIFFEGIALHTTSKARWIWSPEYVPVDLLVDLETIEIHGFRGIPDEVALVEHLLEHAEDLEDVTIYCYEGYLGEKGVKRLLSAQDRILNYPIASPSCELTIM